MRTSKRRLPRLLAAVLCLILLISTSAAEESAEDLLSVFTLNHGSRESKKIAITMDDVYEPEWVWKTAELCKQYGITMTFFPIGINVKEADGDNWRALVEAGHEIGSHSSNHKEFHDIGDFVAIERLGKFQERLDRALGYHYPVRWFRPPFGNINAQDGTSRAMVRAIRTFGYDHIVRWDVSETDPVKAFPKVQNGSILLYHARHKDYVCLETLIPQLLEAGFEPVTVSELFGFDKPEAGGEMFVYDKEKYKNKE
ncbi:MAG: polysaccharide deacetylase family protein [Clostridia bacterium]|nr:polysaccharide deacetylase family protein [Clostridia bacterium]